MTFGSQGSPTYGDIIAHVDDGQSVEIFQEWETGTTYYMAVRTTASSGTQSAWSEPVSLYVADPVSVAIWPAEDLTVYCNFVSTTVTPTESGADISTTQGQRYENYRSGLMEATQSNKLTYVTVNEATGSRTTTEIYPYASAAGRIVVTHAMPITVTVIGAGATGTTVLSIVRAEDYHLYRPDDKEFDGYEGETIVTYNQTGEDPITITVDDLIGRLDDGARYTLIATVIDEYGQTASDTVDFTIDWTHKADVPGAEVRVDKYLRIAKITPIAPEGYAAGDTCDIYRITADQPELVYKGAEFGTTYVDPYPAFGDFCGHRLVTVTANGDYTSASGLAWYDADSNDGDLLEEKQMIIDVDGDQIELPYNIELANTWRKDFQRTEYLGGSVQGDWNPAVTRDLNAKTVLLRGRDLDKQLSMRDLAGYAGVAHIRTPDGSSLTCDIQVRENMDYKSKRVSYTLSVQAVDPEGTDGMTLAEWEAAHPQ